MLFYRSKINIASEKFKRTATNWRKTILFVDKASEDYSFLHSIQGLLIFHLFLWSICRLGMSADEMTQRLVTDSEIFSPLVSNFRLKEKAHLLQEAQFNNSRSFKFVNVCMSMMCYNRIIHRWYLEFDGRSTVASLTKTIIMGQVISRHSARMLGSHLFWKRNVS